MDNTGKEFGVRDETAGDGVGMVLVWGLGLEFGREKGWV